MLIADCHAHNLYSPQSEDERVANARLIACAPELLDTLSLFVDCVDGKYNELVEIAKPLLQRARGECDHILDFGKCRFCGFIDDSIINH